MMYKLNLTQSLVPTQTDDVVYEITVGGLLRKTATAHGHKTGLVEVGMTGEIGRSYTYDQLLTQSETLALALSSRYAPGERICIWAPNIPEWLLMEYACSLAGLTLVTANPSFQEKELRYVLAQSGAVALFHINEYRGNPMAEIADRATADRATAGSGTIREVVDMEDEAAMWRHGDRSPELPIVHPGDPAQIQYTSGTTGFPKGAVLTHRGLVNNARYYAGRLQTTDETVWANIMPMFHTSGCGMVSLGCLQAGCKMLLFKLFDPDIVLDLTEHEKVTTILGVPTMMVGLVEAQATRPRDVSSLTMLSSGGSMVAPELVRNLCDTFNCAFGTLYGQTEASPVITQHHPTDTLDDICHTIGQPVPQTAVSIRSVGANEVVPLDTVGEICAKGPCNMIEYNANPAATASTLDTEGWLHTGDLGAMDARGYVRITGRVKEMIIRGGENLFPAEIENVLLDHPLVVEVAVVGLPDPKWGEIVACFFRAVENQAGGTQAGGTQVVETEELHRHCRKHLSPIKTPVVWRQVEAFPLTGSGKIQKFALRESYLAENK
ncbi:MAG: class I adenylate-forming enzyme family protein [Chloroflexota bacterium]